MTDKLSKDELLYWFNKYWVFPKPSHEHWKPTSQAYQQIVALIKSHPNLNQNMAQSKGKVTEEWIEEKAIRLFKMAMKWFSDEKTTSQQKIEIGQGFIRSLVEEIK